ncbi:MAG: hypothetical protein IJX74_03165 [Clostridia bacterium]|nr:hypothetical protein [Clostridia bacterium]
MKRTKLQTIGYIFLHTVVMQLLVIAIFAFVAYIAYFGVAKYNDGILSIVGVLAFLAMMFSYLCISILKKSYGVSVFAKTRGTFNGTAFKSDPIKTVEYSVGRRDSFTGRRKIYVREREEKGGGCAIVFLGIPAIVTGVTGIFKFVLESVRVLLSDDRQEAWEESREYYFEKMEAEGKRSFFKVPIICAVVLVIAMVISFPVVAIYEYKYSTDRIDFSIMSKENVTDQYGREFVVFGGKLKNTGDAEIEMIEGYMVFLDESGEELYRGKLKFKALFSTSADYDEFLSKDEEWETEVSLSVAESDIIDQMKYMDLSDIKIVFEITEIHYAGDMFIDFPNTPVTVKPLG